MARPRKKLPAAGEEPDLSASMRQGVELERWSWSDTDELWFRHPPARIAEKVGVSRQAVEKWRKNPRYIQALVWRASQQASATYHEPYDPKLGDPVEGAERDGLVFSEGAWQERYELRPELKRKLDAYRHHKAKKGDAT